MSDTNWKSQSGYIWSLIGSAVGFANILSFSAVAYKNGGGAFLLPYIMALFVLGIPFLLLEGYLGQKWKLPLVSVYGKQGGKTGKILGWLAVLACVTIGGFYVVLTGYSAAYTYFSAANLIPEDSKIFFTQTFLQTTDGLANFGSLSIPIFISTAVVMALTWFVLVRSVKDGIEKICSFFMPMMAVIITLFAIAVNFLPGGLQGWAYYLKPDFSRLLDPLLWRDVFGQLFFSLSLGLGIIIGYSRHTEKSMSIGKAMLFVALGDFAISFIAGSAIFGFLAHASFIQNVPFDSILTSDSTFDIGFVLFPKMLKLFGPLLSVVIGVVFFFCVFVAGITGVFSIVESIAGNIEVEFSTTRKRAVTVTCAMLMTVGTLFCMGNAGHMIDALAPMVLGTNMLISGLALALAFQYSAFAKQNPLWRQGEESRFFGFCLRYIAPTLLAVILIGNVWGEMHDFTLAKAVRWGWLVGALAISSLLVFRTDRQVVVANQAATA